MLSNIVHVYPFFVYQSILNLVYICKIITCCVSVFVNKTQNNKLSIIWFVNSMVEDISDATLIMSIYLISKI
jgi:hypothetical protein